MGIQEQIKEIEAEMARTQKNKATEHHLGRLKAKIAKLRAKLIEESTKKGPAGSGFDVPRAGHARAALIGFPSVGKSSFLNYVTNTQSVAAAYEFTTLTAIPGNLIINETIVQVLDLPGIIEGAAQGVGRGKEVISAARNSDMILMMVDAVKADVMIDKLTAELRSTGIRLNEIPADISFSVKKMGGVKFNSTLPLTHCDERMVKGILQEFKIHHAEVVFREDATADQFTDIVVGNRRYLPCLYVINKIDNVSVSDLDKLARRPDTVVCSVKKGWNLEFLSDRIWDYLSLTRIYTKKKGGAVDLSEPVILRPKYGRKPTIQSVCEHIHRDMVKKFKYARVWGKSSRFCPKSQRVGLAHEIADQDVVEIVAET